MPRFPLWQTLLPVGLLIFLSVAHARAAVISQTYALPLGINTAYGPDGMGPRYIIGGNLYRFDWRAAPMAFDFDRNGTVDLTIGGSGRTTPDGSFYMYVTQHGSNQVWALAGGVAGLDFGSHALALLGGSSLGPALTSDVDVIGWHNDDDTRSTSILMQALSGRKVSGDFFPTTLFEQKYLGFRFEGEGGLHYGWMALSGYVFFGEEIYVYSWAYESEPNTALIVGQVPEPTVPMLLGMGLWLGMRRRRLHAVRVIALSPNPFGVP
jgi:hypothetical protein